MNGATTIQERLKDLRLNKGLKLEEDVYKRQVINLAALGKPFPMFVHCPHSEQDMGVRIVSRRVGL